jgi:hypothetical protein
MYGTIALAVIHALLSAGVLVFDDKMTSQQRMIFLVVSIVVNIIIAFYAYSCLKLKVKLE